VNQELILCSLLELNTKMSFHMQLPLVLTHVNVSEQRTFPLATLSKRDSHSFMVLIANLGIQKRLTAKRAGNMKQRIGVLILISGAMWILSVSLESILLCLPVPNMRINLHTAQNHV
jgi:hypothetical protein